MAEKVERRLAAVLSADIVGYSRLMPADEAGTLARLANHTFQGSILPGAVDRAKLNLRARP